MTRVWLSRWEWACCGDPFDVGDEVDFGIATRDLSDLTASLGPELVVTIDAWESHHEEEFADRAKGRVAAAYEVTHEVVERKIRLPRDGSHGRRLARKAVMAEPVSGTTRLDPVGRVPSADTDSGRTGALPADAPSQEEQRRRVRSGWLVDIEQ